MTLTKPFLSAVLYVALALGAIPLGSVTASAQPSRAALQQLRQGDMRKLAILRSAGKMPDVWVLDMAGNNRALKEFKGQYVLLNFWATWCAPCRAEMPSLDTLQKQIGSDKLKVLLIATGRNPPPAIRKFFKDAKITSLETLRDPSQTLSSLLGVFGLPMTLILNPEGKEIARMQGDADWSSPEAVSFLTALVNG